MAFRDWFMVYRSVAPATKAPAGGGGDGGTQPRDAAFLTPASLVSFPFAVGVIKLVQTIIVSFKPEWKESNLLILVLAVLYGLFLIYLDFTDPEKGGDPRKPVKFVIGGLNALLLYAAVVGLPYAFGP